ncbi:hypothetical protein H0H87_011139, partial [Tephrocybe sp. NHM501043]
MKKITKGFRKVGRKFDSLLSPTSRSSSPARESTQITSGASSATRASTPHPDDVSHGTTAAEVAVTAAMGLHVLETNAAVSTQGNLSQSAGIPSITVDLAGIESAPAPSLTSGEIISSAAQASTVILATGPLQASGSPNAGGFLADDEVTVPQVPHRVASTGYASQVIDHPATAQESTGTNMHPMLPQLAHIDASTARNTKMKSGLHTAWSGTQMLLSRVAGLLDGTPFKTPVAAINVIIKLANDVAENNDALKDIMTNTEKRLDTVATELTKEGDTVANAMIQDFAGTLIEKILELHLMSTKATWKKILESDDDKTKISRMFKEIDEQTKNFHLKILLLVERAVRGLGDSFQRLLLNNWPYSRTAQYNTDLQDAALLARRACTDGTRVHILERISEWAQDSSPLSPQVFWLTGQAGSGKSTIAYSIARDFDKGGKRLNLLQATFFCSRQFKDTKSRNYIIPTIAYQLARHSRSFSRALLNAEKEDS